MATYNVESATSQTLTGTTVDTLIFTAPQGEVRVVNREAANTIWVTSGITAATPAVAGDGSIPVLAGQTAVIAQGTPVGFQVKVIGNGDDYSVYGGPRTPQGGIRGIKEITAAEYALIVRDPEVIYAVTAT